MFEIRILDNSELHGIVPLDDPANNEYHYKGKCWRRCHECGGTVTTIGWFATGKTLDYQRKYNPDIEPYTPEPHEMLSNISSICDSCDYNEFS